MAKRLLPWLRRHRWYAGGLALLGAALLLTGLMRWWQTHRVIEAGASRQAAVVEEVLDTAEGAFAELRQRVQRRACRMADRPEVVRSLQADQKGKASSEALVRWMTEQRVPERWGVEIYNRNAFLQAWRGVSLPFATPGVSTAEQVRVVSDEDVRWGLAAWCPVQAGGDRVGMVRAALLVRFRVPVQNQYIGDYSLAETWSRQTGYAVAVELGSEVGEAETESPASTARLLRAADGTVLGRVIVQQPSVEQLVQETVRRFNDVLALWAALGLIWLIAGGWMGYRAIAPEPGASWTHLRRAAGAWLVVAAAWWGVRYLLIGMDVPARWQPSSSKAPLAPLFDPTHLASAFGGGLMRSAGDLLITGVFAALFAAAALHLAAWQRAATLSELRAQLRDVAGSPAAGRFSLVVGGTVVLGAALTWGIVRLVQHAVIDSTLDFFARTGLLPEPLVLIVLCGLLLTTVAVVLVLIAWSWIALRCMARYRPEGARGIGMILCGALGAGIALGAAYPLAGEHRIVAALLVPTLWVAVVVPAWLGLLQQRRPLVAHFTLRGLLPAIFGVTLLLYPLLYSGMDTQRRGRMVDALQSFEEGQNPQVSFALEQMLQSARRDSALRQIMMQPEATTTRLDSVALRLLRESLVASLEEYETTLLFLDAERRLQGRYTAAGARLRREPIRPQDATAFQALRARYVVRPTGAPLVRQQAGRRRGAAWYEGLVALPARQDSGAVGWVWVQSEPRSVLPGADTPFPRIFLPDGLYSDVYAELSLAEFREGRLVRSLGEDFARMRLSDPVRQAVQEGTTAWQRERIHGRTYITYYERREAASGTSVGAVRVPAVTPFDHLYYLLRLAVAGLCIGGPFYLMGLVLRYRRGLLPAPRIRFRDKVLDAFLAVGAVSVVAVGLVGMGVVTGETEHAVESLLQQNLERVEDALLYRARRGEQPYEVAGRIGIDSLAAQVGVDLNLYADGRLVATSRPRLIRDRLMEMRLPVEAYRALYLEGERFVTVNQRYGGLSYASGFHALVDAEGTPRYVLSSPTLPEQERIKEERARTLASLFGALLLLLVIVMITALFLAQALTKPIARLREGLEAVGEGRFARKLPVDTRDEIGELVQTFNEMREQLAESRRQLAQQEREMAWREMARQVAHEIKNPLTPMKLSVQHLRRAFERQQVAVEAPDQSAPEELKEDEGFAALFDRITGTLIEQINALAHIANEFSTFARLPTQVPEPLDLNEVIREATALMREESDVEIDIDLHPEPLIVEADPEELRRIYINLIKNAIQAIPDDRSGRIAITSEPRMPDEAAAPQAYSTVADNGIGIPEERRDKIFQPNFSTKTSGTGLGLAIAKRSIEELDGAIGFETTEGEGTTFWIRLPRAEA